VEADERAGVLTSAFLRPAPFDRAALVALPPSAEADDGNLLTEAPGAPAKLFTIGGLRLELDALLPAN